MGKNDSRTVGAKKRFAVYGRRIELPPTFE